MVLLDQSTINNDHGFMLATDGEQESRMGTREANRLGYAVAQRKPTTGNTNFSRQTRVTAVAGAAPYIAKIKLENGSKFDAVSSH